MIFLVFFSFSELLSSGLHPQQVPQVFGISTGRSSSLHKPNPFVGILSRSLWGKTTEHPPQEKPAQFNEQSWLCPRFYWKWLFVCLTQFWCPFPFSCCSQLSPGENSGGNLGGNSHSQSCPAGDRDKELCPLIFMALSL